MILETINGNLLENITGDLLAYKKLKPGTLQHADQLTTERRTNPELKGQCYTADGNLYTVQEGKTLWGITRELQNLVLQNIDEAYRQLTRQDNNYFPDAAEVAKASLEHPDTIVNDLEGLTLRVRNIGDQSGYFVVDPRRINGLNSEKRKVVQRLFGPDENNLGLNMEMFAKAGKTLYIVVLTPDYVQSTLRCYDKEFFGRASCLDDFLSISIFHGNNCNVYLRYALRGVRRIIAEGSAEKNEVPSAPQEITSEKPAIVTLERML